MPSNNLVISWLGVKVARLGKPARYAHEEGPPRWGYKTRLGFPLAIKPPPRPLSTESALQPKPERSEASPAPADLVVFCFFQPSETWWENQAAERHIYPLDKLHNLHLLTFLTRGRSPLSSPSGRLLLPTDDNFPSHIPSVAIATLSTMSGIVITLSLLACILVISEACNRSAQGGLPAGYTPPPSADGGSYGPGSGPVPPHPFRRRRDDDSDNNNDVQQSQVVTRMMQKLFVDLDVDGDGSVCADEWAKRGGIADDYTQLLADFDRNGDGILSFDEFLSASKS
ncbi:uncharacterized protein LOC110977711 [Acanthaster planci]|uniref:Uncharacterized protein LOC110977711 n=1 Tax=Acanthaster planci TaxID=133434 RepID=A0A8B7Y5X7_ACAPL|nr:uncharacterized protein LOC110977711 [Acanthaster planci]